MSRIFILCLSILFLTNTQGQDFYFSRPAHSLSQKTVNVIVQDSLGFIWIGTENGLNRYDGEAYQVYYKNPNDFLRSSSIAALFPDQNGNIWIGTYGGGLSLFSPTEHRFINEQINPSFRESLDKLYIQSIYESSDSIIWIGTESNGIIYWDKKNGDTGQLIANGREGLSNNHIEGITEDAYGNIWVATYGGGLGQYNHEKKMVSIHDYQTDENIPEDGVIRKICKNASGVIWIGTNDGIRFLEQDRFGQITIQNPSDFNPSLASILNGTVILSLMEDKSGRIWIGTENEGLILWERKQNEVHQYKNDVNNRFGLHSNSIWSLFEDRDGTVWIGSYKSGVRKIDPYEHRFGLITESSGKNRSISRGLVSSFTEDAAGNLWIGTEGGGLDLMDSNHNIRNVSNQEFPGMESEVIVALVTDNQDRVYAATWGKGLFVKEPREKRFSRFRMGGLTSQDTGLGEFIRSLYKDQQGEIWIASYRWGLSRYIPETKEFFTYKAGASQNMVNSNNIIAMVRDSSGVLWIGHRTRGLDKITFDQDRNIKTVQNFSSTSQAELDIPDNINYLFLDSQDNIWIGSNGEGIVILDPRAGTTVHLTTEEKLPGNVIYGILEDENKKVWTSTNNGLARLNIHPPFSIKSYDTYDGLQDKEFTLGACYKKRDGTLIFGGINGFNFFNHQDIFENSNQSPFYLSALHIAYFNADNGRQDTQVVYFPKEQVILKSFQNDLRFEFATLNFSQANKNTYMYKLANLDDEWSSPTQENYANYLNVPPGNYQFQVKAANNDGVWNELVQILDIKIDPPWYWSTLSKLIYIIALLALLIFVFNMLLNREKLKNQLQLEQVRRSKVKEMSQIKSRFFASISHEFKTPLTLIQSPLEELSQMKVLQPFKGHFSLIHKNAQRLQKLIDEILELSKVESGNAKVEYEVRDMTFFLRSVLDYFSSYAEKQHLTLTHDIPAKEMLLAFDPDKMEKILFNLISNAIKFTPAGGKIHTALFEGEDFIQLNIMDTGKGIEEKHQDYIFDLYNSYDNPDDSNGTGIGLNLARHYVELHNGKIWVESKLGEGSTFSIQLPKLPHLDEEKIGEGGLQFAELMTTQVESLSDLKEYRNQGNADPLQKPIILIAEDNMEIREFLCNILKDDYRIIPCNNGAEAYEQALLSIPDLILSDVIMPEMDGYDLCKKIRENPKTCHIIFFILSVKSGEKNLGEGLNKGADHYLAKPFNPTHLKLLIKNSINKRNEFKRKLLNQKIMSTDTAHTEPKSKDENFLSEVVKIIEEKLSDPGFGVEELCRELGYSKSQLYRKMKALLGQSANEFIRSLRLKRAAALIEQKTFTITEITYKVGFLDIQYFRKCFKKQFGINPSEYNNQKSLKS